MRCKSGDDASSLLQQTCGEGYELALLQGMVWVVALLLDVAIDVSIAMANE